MKSSENDHQVKDQRKYWATTKSYLTRWSRLHESNCVI